MPSTGGNVPTRLAYPARERLRAASRLRPSTLFPRTPVITPVTIPARNPGIWPARSPIFSCTLIHADSELEKWRRACLDPRLTRRRLSTSGGICARLSSGAEPGGNRTVDRPLRRTVAGAGRAVAVGGSRDHCDRSTQRRTGPRADAGRGAALDRRGDRVLQRRRSLRSRRDR